MKKIIIAVAVVLVGILGYVFIDKINNEDMGKSTVISPSSTNESKNTAVSSENAGFVGKWEVAGNDFEYTTIVLGSDSSFVMNGYFVQNPDKPYEFTGSWSTSQKNGDNYLTLMLNTPTTVPTDVESIARYKSWGQEFVGDREVHLKITTNNGVSTFRYDGNLMLKAN